jgi:hypothetical protein
MKRILKLGMVLGVMLLTGCVGITYTSSIVQPNGVTNSITIKTSRVFWSTESYTCAINTNGTGTLSATKSKVDSETLAAIVSAAVSAALK